MSQSKEALSIDNSSKPISCNSQDDVENKI